MGRRQAARFKAGEGRLGSQDRNNPGLTLTGGPKRTRSQRLRAAWRWQMIGTIVAIAAAIVAYRLGGDVGWAAGTGIFVLGGYFLLSVLEGGWSFRSNALWDAENRSLPAAQKKGPAVWGGGAKLHILDKYDCVRAAFPDSVRSGKKWRLACVLQFWRWELSLDWFRLPWPCQ